MGLLGRAKSMMQGWTATVPSAPQFYNVACPEGHRLRGPRTDGYQALRCPTCGEGIFVLPRSPLPNPPAPASSGPARLAPADSFAEDAPIVLSDPPPSSTAQLSVDEAEAEIDWVDELPPEAETPSKPLPARKIESNAPPKAPTPTPTPRPKPRPVEPAPLEPVEPRLTIAEWARAHRNGLIVAAALILVTGLVLYRVRRNRLDNLPEIAEIGRTEGIKKLDAGEFFAAKKLLGDASDAVDGMGGQYEGAEAIRQGAREAALFADLAPSGLEEIVEEAQTTDAKGWPAKFAALYRGRSIILDPEITSVADPAKPGSKYEVNCPIYFGRGPKPEGRGRVDLTGFRLFELAQPKVGEQKPFGARLAKVEFDVAQNEWVISFEPDSGAYITHDKALATIHWGSAEATEEPPPP